MSERIVTYEGEEILRIAEDGTITVQPNVTVETVARILVEAMNQKLVLRFGANERNNI